MEAICGRCDERVAALAFGGRCGERKRNFAFEAVAGRSGEPNGRRGEAFSMGKLPTGGSAFEAFPMGKPRCGAAARAPIGCGAASFGGADLEVKHMSGRA